MLKRRGYELDVSSGCITPDDEYVTATMDPYNEGCVNHRQHQHDYVGGGRVLVYFVKYIKVSIDIIKSVVTLSTHKLRDITHIIIIHSKSLTSDAKSAIAVNKVFVFETFTFEELSYDLIDIVPPHSLVKSASSADKPKEWTKFPIILASDIVSRYYGFKRGDIVRIEEDGIVSYRRCV